MTETASPDSSAEQPAPAGRTPELVLREPAERVSPRAKTLWRVSAIPPLVILGLALLIVPQVDDVPVLVSLAIAAALSFQIAYAVIVPVIRFRVHRWEVTHEAFYTQSGWLSRQVRIIPLNRVQTVDSSQGALERAFGLASVRVTTASGHGTAYVQGLEEGLAKQVVADLVRDTAAVEGDAT